MSGLFTKPLTLEELRATVAALELSRPVLAGFLVAPDIAEKLKAQTALVAQIAAESLTVTVVKWLEPGTMIPVDREGRPLPKPKDGAR